MTVRIVQQWDRKPGAARPELSEEDIADARAADEAIAEGGFEDWEDVKRELGLDDAADHVAPRRHAAAPSAEERITDAQVETAARALWEQTGVDYDRLKASRPEYLATVRRALEAAARAQPKETP
jgi:hypothetical protein